MKKSTPNDESIGDWEKHTKGIGLKLLQKFGFKGRLGANENGVSRAIEVVVRPNQQGLGFGDIKEASQLKINKKIEAEWRGVEYIDEEKEKKRKSSAIEVLASSKEWKKGKSSGGSSDQTKKYSTDEFIAKYMKANDNNEGTKQVIIDMRYKDTRVITDMSDIKMNIDEDEASEYPIKTLLGQELLYNINLIANAKEMNVTKDSKQLAQEVNKLTSYNQEKSNLMKSIQNDESRLIRLNKIKQILLRIDDKIQTNKDEVKLNHICDLFQTLYSNFTEEFTVFGLIHLLPYLISQIIIIDDWKPFDNYYYLTEIHNSIQPLIHYFQSIQEISLSRQITKIFQDIIEKKFLPLVRRTIASNWNVQSEPELCVKLIECLKYLLSTDVYEQTIDMLIIPKLTNTVNEWKPSIKQQQPINLLDPSEKLLEQSTNYFIHTWLHPWLPLLTTKLSALYPEIRRKFNTLIINTIPQDIIYLLPMLQPWLNVFDATSMDALLVKAILPKLVVILQDILVINPSNQDIAPIQWVLAWYGTIPNMNFTCLLLGEFFPKWLRVLYIWLTNPVNSPDYEEISVWYSGWKGLFPEEILSDESIMHCFNIALDMMQTSLLDDDENGGDEADGSNNHMKKYDIICKQMEDNSYFQLIEDRKTLLRAKRRLESIEEDEMKGYHSIIRQATAIGVGSRIESITYGKITFKEIVEKFAIQHNIEFTPKLGKFYEQKQLWLFGNILCYFDQNVIFASNNINNSNNKKEDSKGLNEDQQQLYNWLPVTLEELLSIHNKS